MQLDVGKRWNVTNHFSRDRTISVTNEIIQFQSNKQTALTLWLVSSLRSFQINKQFRCTYPSYQHIEFMIFCVVFFSLWSYQQSNKTENDWNAHTLTLIYRKIRPPFFNNTQKYKLYTFFVMCDTQGRHTQLDWNLNGNCFVHWDSVQSFMLVPPRSSLALLRFVILFFLACLRACLLARISRSPFEWIALHLNNRCMRVKFPVAADVALALALALALSSTHHSSLNVYIVSMRSFSFTANL